MSFDHIKRIARCITEDPDVFAKYQDKFRDHTVLDAEVFGEIVGILQDVAKENGLTLDRSRLKVRFNPSGISIKNISLDSPNSATKRELAHHMAAVTGDDNIKHTFSRNLKINLYQAISGQFADRVREELNLEVTHQAHDPESSQDSALVLPMATFTQPAVTAEMPEEELDVNEPMGTEPEGGPQPFETPDEGGMGMGGGLPMPGGGLDLEPPTEEPEVGDFGLEPPAPEGEEEGGEEEEAAPSEPETVEASEDEIEPASESIDRIANILLEDYYF